MMSSSSSSSCLGRAAVPVKRVWRGLSSRVVGRTTTGKGRLRKEVRTCEYNDVHVMWEMLGGMMAGDDDDMAGTGRTRKRRGRKKHHAPWSRLVAYCCGAF
ncbi:hypothetical protein PR202_ga28607 [Eleusine coracana subsp. coracana]|uniref:Uncharacterized protein n=1 Tax=Eleusine coracana subsp. coracana TaxID=191504 RepID=A0AAV5DJP2_ELECO|nr:hypothetical protein PR202_ga28607 [Eleusine coracana subsp. coracana]